MKCEFLWTRPAQLDMWKIRGYLRINRPEAEDHVIGLIGRAVANLADNPCQGDVHLRSNGDEIRQIFAASYRIFFRVNEEDKRIDILKVWHTSRSEPDLREFE